jgi:hypothetical protein
MNDPCGVLIINPYSLSFKGNEKYAWKYMHASKILYEIPMHKRNIS